ncbi:MAG: substrate-binding domain-containing protein [Desulfosoma sp.]
MKKAIQGVLRLLVVLGVLEYAAAGNAETLMMATTTSTDATGFLDALAPKVKEILQIDLRWVATGTGKALELGKRCDVDILLVHAPRAEKEYVQHGYGVNRRVLMYNDFVLVGPPSDPAKVKGSEIEEAMRRIAGSKASFVSRGDNSGTHMKEIELWRAAGLADVPSYPEYLETGQGMMATLEVASQRRAYTLTDRATLAKFGEDAHRASSLPVLVEGAESLKNYYSLITVNPEKCPKVRAASAEKFTEWMVGPEGQAFIGAFRVGGRPVFLPDAQRRQ